MKLGEFLVSNNFISKHELNFALEDQKYTQKLLGEILVELGFLPSSLLNIFLALYENRSYKLLFSDALSKNLYKFSKGEYIYKYGNLIFSTKEFFEKYSLEDKGYKLFEVKKGFKVDFQEEINLSLTTPQTFLQNLILFAVYNEISDLHFEPFSNIVRLKVRKLGKIQYLLNFSKDFYKKFLISLKSFSNLDYTKTATPQDGRIYLKTQLGNVYLRLSFLPGIYGENLVIRVLNKKGGILRLNHLGLEEKYFEILKKIKNIRHGLILICGSTGSGKTTTLYALIRELFSPEKNIITIEEPVEYLYPAIRQIEVNEKLSFYESLKASLRQDPDVIVLGEIRDENTAKTALRAAQTGHLVIASLHSYSLETTISRLVNLGLDKEEIKEVLKMVVIQELIDIKCPFCKGKGCNICFKGIFDKRPSLKVFKNFPA